jgi:hypothetical protein
MDGTKREIDKLRRAIVVRKKTNAEADLPPLYKSLITVSDRMRDLSLTSMKPLNDLKAHCRLAASDPKQARLLKLSTDFDQQLEKWRNERERLKSAAEGQSSADLNDPQIIAELDRSVGAGSPKAGVPLAADPFGEAPSMPTPANVKLVCAASDLSVFDMTVKRASASGAKLKSALAAAMPKLAEISDPSKPAAPGRQQLARIESIIGELQSDYGLALNDARQLRSSCRLPEGAEGSRIGAAFVNLESSTVLLSADFNAYRAKATAVRKRLQ